MFSRLYSLLLCFALSAFCASEAEVLVKALDQPKFWSAVHAAEYLIELKQERGVVEEFLKKQKTAESIPINRIGIWRVQAQHFRTLGMQAEYNAVISKLKGVAYSKPAASDQIHALETLFKLREAPTEEEQRKLIGMRSAKDASALLQIYSAALLALSKQEEKATLSRLFINYKEEQLNRGVLLYVLQAYPTLPDDLLKSIDAFQRNTKSSYQRAAALRILLKNKKLSFAQIGDLETTGEYLKLLLEHAPQSETCKKAISQLAKSDNLESQILAAYAVLKTKENVARNNN